MKNETRLNRSKVVIFDSLKYGFFQLGICLLLGATGAYTLIIYDFQWVNFVILIISGLGFLNMLSGNIAYKAYIIKESNSIELVYFVNREKTVQIHEKDLVEVRFWNFSRTRLNELVIIRESGDSQVFKFMGSEESAVLMTNELLKSQIKIKNPFREQM